MSPAVLERPLAPVGDPAPSRPPRPRLSELMREGAMQTPQEKSVLHNRRTGATCALGTVLMALVGPTVFTAPAGEIGTSALVYEHTGVRLDKPVPPALRALCGWHKDTPCTLGMAIVYLNDRIGWSREEIADYLESIGY